MRSLVCFDALSDLVQEKVEELLEEAKEKRTRHHTSQPKDIQGLKCHQARVAVLNKILDLFAEQARIERIRS